MSDMSPFYPYTFALLLAIGVVVEGITTWAPPDEKAPLNPVLWENFTDNSLRGLQFGIPAGTTNVSSVIADLTIEEATGHDWSYYQAAANDTCRKMIKKDDHMKCVWMELRKLIFSSDVGFCKESNKKDKPCPFTWDRLTVLYHFAVCNIFSNETTPDYAKPSCPSACASNPCQIKNVDRQNPCTDLSLFVDDFKCNCVGPFHWYKNSNKCVPRKEQTKDTEEPKLPNAIKNVVIVKARKEDNFFKKNWKIFVSMAGGAAIVLVIVGIVCYCNYCWSNKSLHRLYTCMPL